MRVEETTFKTLEQLEEDFLRIDRMCSLGVMLSMSDEEQIENSRNYYKLARELYNRYKKEVKL